MGERRRATKRKNHCLFCLVLEYSNESTYNCREYRLLAVGDCDG